MEHPMPAASKPSEIARANASFDEALDTWISTNEDWSDAANYIVATAKTPLAWRWMDEGRAIEFYVP